MPPMKISGVDRCGCLIQSARLESSDLRHYNHHRRCRHHLHHHHLHQRRRYRRFQPPFRLAFKPLSQSDVTPSSGESNPFGQSTSSLFVPGPFSFLPSSFSVAFFRFCLSVPFFRPPVFLLYSGPSWPLWLCFSRENLSQGKDSLSKGVVIGSPGRFDLLTPRPFSHTRRHRCQLNNVSNVSFLTNSSAVRNSRKVSMENWLDRAISCRGVKYILTYYLKNRVNILGYFFEYQRYRYQIW